MLPRYDPRYAASSVRRIFRQCGSWPKWTWPLSGGIGLVSDEAAFRAGRHAVHALNFFVAAVQTGFGPFVSVWLVSKGWTLTEVGIALSVGTVAGLCGQ